MIKFFSGLRLHQQPYSDTFISVEIAVVGEQRSKTIEGLIFQSILAWLMRALSKHWSITQQLFPWSAAIKGKSYWSFIDTPMNHPNAEGESSSATADRGRQSRCHQRHRSKS